jgi:DNA polymerase-3 subunit delta
MSVEKLINDWKNKIFKPVYLLHGEEDYFIDQVIDYAEKNILTESESSFNLTVFYGKDADWINVVNACKRYPMFSELQVVIIKEAQMMNNIDKLELYMESPLSSTIFVIGHKYKTYDKRTKLYKLIEKKGEVFLSLKINDEKVHDLIYSITKKHHFNISEKAVLLMQQNIGNNLSRIVTEIEKLLINLKDKNTIDEDDVEKYIGISKEYNVFELQETIAKRDLLGSLKIINYFASNPKASPIHATLPALYAFFSKVYSVYGLSDKSESAIKPIFYNNYYSTKQGMTAMKNYGYAGVERVILLLQHYNLKSLGVGDTGSEDAMLMREMVVKMMLKD